MASLALLTITLFELTTCTLVDLMMSVFVDEGSNGFINNFSYTIENGVRVLDACIVTNAVPTRNSFMIGGHKLLYQQLYGEKRLTLPVYVDPSPQTAQKSLIFDGKVYRIDKSGNSFCLIVKDDGNTPDGTKIGDLGGFNLPFNSQGDVILAQQNITPVKEDIFLWGSSTIRIVYGNQMWAIAIAVI